jgi:sulfur carrier protein ThiS
MTIMLRAGGQLREMLKPDVDYYTRKVECPDNSDMETILKQIGLEKKYIAFIYVDGKVRDFSYIPQNGQIVTLQPPVSGG